MRVVGRFPVGLVHLNLMTRFAVNVTQEAGRAASRDKLLIEGDIRLVILDYYW